MPFRFACQHCGQLFNVSSKKIGIQLHCPKCQASIVVPTMEDAANSAAPKGPGGPELAVSPPLPPPAAAAPPPAREGPPEDGWKQPAPPPVDCSKLTISRKVVYTQGILLGVVGLLAFLLGILVARTWPDSPDGATAGVQTPGNIRGQITYTASDGSAAPDVGCVVLAVPANSLPDEKLEIRGLRPQDRKLPIDHSTIQALRVLGGAQARTDDQGSFQLDLPHSGPYFLLLVSARARRRSGNLPNGKDLAEMGRYVTSAFELLGAHQYHWTQRRLRSETRLDWQFGRTTD